MIPSDTWPYTHHDLVSHYHTQYEKNIASGKFEPLIYPWGSLGALVVILYLLIPHQDRPWLRKARYIAFAFYVAHTVYTILYVRAKNMAVSPGIGLISAWGMIWVLAILVCNDPQTDFMRIERMEGLFSKRKGRQNGIIQNEMGSNGVPKQNAANGNGTLREHLGPSERHGEFAWQAYPVAPFIERLDWVMDAFCNFRGAGWNWRTIVTPPPPKAIQEQLRRNSTKFPRNSLTTHASQPHLYSTRRDLLTANAKTLLSGYIILDLLKTIVVHDPYFWGIMDQKPAHYLPTFFISSPTLIHIFRLTVSQFAIMWALKTVFSLAPLFFSGLLGPSILGARAEPWMYPETWGSYTQVLDNGLAGWWSSWWHQTFRFAFEQPSRKLIAALGWDPKAPVSKLLRLIVGFSLSGVLHAGGSYTCYGSARPFLGPIRFFLLQALALFVEAMLKQSIRKTGIQHHIPQWLRRSFTFFYVHFWFYHTAHLICDDFAQGGMWLFEPVPVSLFRGLGLGTEGDSWWCWGGDGGLRWYRGDTWWKSGLAL